MVSCLPDNEAETIFEDLTKDLNTKFPDIDLDDSSFQIPGDTSSDLYSVLKKLTMSDLTQRIITGSGAFDVLMSGMKSQLVEEYEKGRISGAEYTKAYIAGIEAAVSGSIQFLLGKDQAFWQGQQAQIAAINARVELARTKVELARAQIEAETSKAQYALTKMQLANASMEYDKSKYEVENILPAQLAETNAQREGIELDNQTKQYTLVNILPIQRDEEIMKAIGINTDNQTKLFNLESLLPAQLSQTNAQTALISSQKQGQDYQNSEILPAQKDHEVAETALLGSQKTGQDYQNVILLPDQHNLLQEQIEVQRAQVSDTTTTGTPVTGILGGQKALYLQQIESYKRDAEVKAAKLWMDGWSVMRTTDEGLNPPANMSNDKIDVVLADLMAKNGFV